MRALTYTASLTPRHNIYVSTWQETGEWWVRFTVDAKVGEPQPLGPVEKWEAPRADR